MRLFYAGNQLGCGFAILGAVIASITVLIPSLPMIAGVHPIIGNEGAVWIIADLVYRAIKNTDRGLVRFIHPTLGGSILMIPLWILGIILCVGLPIVVAQ